jgi:hypothetical protein
MKVNRKSTPKMVVRPHFRTEYEKFQAESHRQERFEFTVALMIVWVFAVIIWGVAR